MSEQLPGVDRIDLHEGRFTGAFDLTRADMAQVRYEGRVMICLVGDIVSPLGIVTTKDGDIKAKWTIKPVDVALVRDESMQQHLAQALRMITPEAGEIEEYEEDPEPGEGLVGVYDKEGTFLGFRSEEEIATPEDLEHEWIPVPEEPNETMPLPQRERPRVRPFVDDEGELPPPSEREVFGKPIEHDKMLQEFLGV